MGGRPSPGCSSVRLMIGICAVGVAGTQLPALVSEGSGWRAYPVALGASLAHGQVGFELDYSVLYSSTCPCSSWRRKT